MTDLQQRIDKSLDALRMGLTADGADLKVVARSESDVEVSLVITPETCQDCIVSTDLMETMVKNLVSQEAPEVNVTLIDPREEGA